MDWESAFLKFVIWGLKAAQRPIDPSVGRQLPKDSSVRKKCCF